jgi:hypothetical protein
VDLARIARHLISLPGAVARARPPSAMASIEQTISESEARHRGEIRFAAESSL